MSNQSIIDALAPVISRLKTLNLAEPAAARTALQADFPPDGELMRGLHNQCKAGLREGWLCDRVAGESRFSRVARADAGGGYSIDAVSLKGDGMWHRHVKGEVNCMFAVDGNPKFCGHEAGWAVFPPGSEHVPNVSGGTMMILYLLPDGAVEWKKT